MIFNNVLNDRTLEQAHAICSLYDPYVGEDAGYLQITRLNGHGPALLVIPERKTPFEAYNPILDRNGPHGEQNLSSPTPHREALRSKLGLWLTLDAGTFDALEFDPSTGAVRVGLTSSNEFTPVARLRIEQPAKVSSVGIYLPKSPLNSERGSDVVPLGTGTTWIQVAPGQ